LELELVELVELIFPPILREEIDVTVLKFRTLLIILVVKFVVDVVVTEVNTSLHGAAV
jgi:uncharacterized membrane protein